MKIKLIVISMAVVLTGCAVVKGIHEDNLAAKAAPQPVMTSTQTQNTQGLPRQSQTKNATETTGKMLSPVVN